MTVKWRVFVVSLRRARDRRMNVVKKMLSTDVPFEIVDAVDGSAVLPETLGIQVGKWSLTDGEKACYQSHINILERIVDYGLDYAIVLEDDFKFGPTGHSWLKGIWDTLPVGADHIQLHDMRSHISKQYEIDVEMGLFNKLKVTNYMTVGYIISRKMAAHIIKNFSQPAMPIDHLYVQLSLNSNVFSFYDVNQRLVDCIWDAPSCIRA